jgi:hypothetical protein
MYGYLTPGVYVTEVAPNVRPIEGVSTSTAGFVGSEVIMKLQRLVNQIPPINSEPSGSNPGIALLDLLAWLSDMLAQRSDQLGREAYLPAARIVAGSLALIKNRVPDPSGALKYVRFFEGQLPEDEILRVVAQDQSQHRNKKRNGKRRKGLAKKKRH